MFSNDDHNYVIILVAHMHTILLIVALVMLYNLLLLFQNINEHHRQSRNIFSDDNYEMKFSTTKTQ